VLRLITVLVVLALLTVLGVFAVVGFPGPPTEEELLEEAGLTGRSVLRIGVRADQPGTGYYDETLREFVGFEIDIALMIASDLGFRRDQVEFYQIQSEDRARMQATTPTGEYITVDLVVSSYTITPEREAQESVSFSEPYLLTEQSVVTRRDHPPVEHLGDLRGERVCTITTSTSEGPAIEAGLDLYEQNLASACVAGLLDHTYDAFTTDAAIMAGFVAQYPDQLYHHDIGYDRVEAWGINTGGNEALRTLVNLYLYRSWSDPEDQRWEEAFEEHLAPLQPFNGEQQVAIGEQPKVDPVDVREWP